MNDTVEQPALASGTGEVATATLQRIAGGLEMLASVLTAFPDKNPQLWKTAESAKQTTDLAFACEHLRQYAAQLEEIAEKLKN